MLCYIYCPSYFITLKVYHPDKNKGKSDKKLKENQEKFVEISKAYETLSDEKLRGEYDDSLNPYSNRRNHQMFHDFHDGGDAEEYVQVFRGPNGQVYYQTFYSSSGGGRNRQNNRHQQQHQRYQQHRSFYDEPPLWQQIIYMLFNLMSSMAPILMFLCLCSMIDFTPRKPPAPGRRLDD